MISRLFKFNGGVHVPGKKDMSTKSAIATAAIPKTLIIPVQQHIGKPGELLVSVGDDVKTGQPLTKPSDYVSAPIHASSSGKIVAIEPRPIAHPSGLDAVCVVIETNGKDEWVTLNGVTDVEQLAPEEIRQRVREAGIVGLGGAAFPSAVKLNPGPSNTIDTLIINAAECEPYITCDDMLIREQAPQVLKGINILRRALGVERCLIGIEDNKPAAIGALQESLKTQPDTDGIEVVPVPTIYPTGGEKQLIEVLTGKQVPSNGLPSQIGIVCQNVGTCFAIYEAITTGKPLVERAMTVTGEGVQSPANFKVRIGTRVEDFVAEAGGYTDKAFRCLMGGPMMGFALQHDNVPVVKATNCILVGSQDDLPEQQQAMPCIRCGTCADACPASLLPQQLYWHAKGKEFDKIQDYNLFDCIECGCCSHVCPSNIPLVQYYRFAKTEIYAQEQEARKADIARQRHEFRQERIEKEEAEKAERARLKKEALARKKAAKAAAEAQTDEKGGEENDVIAAALARAKAKKAARKEAPKNTKELTPAQQAQIDAAKKRRKAEKIAPDPLEDAIVKAKAMNAAKAEGNNPAAEAIAKAKAKKAAAEQKSTEESGDPIADAIARAKAKKAAKQAEAAGDAANETSTNDPVADAIAKAAEGNDPVADAIAKAKAKKAAKAEPSTGEASGDPVADAIARAKAKKAAKQAEGNAEEKADDPVAQAVAKAKAKKAAQASDENSDDPVAAAIAKAKAKKAAKQVEQDQGENDGV